jgi:hypothetical protein
MKQDYIKEMSKKTLIIGGLASVVLGLFQYNLGIGLLIGLVVGRLNLWGTTNYVDNLLFNRDFVLSSFLLYTVLNYGLMISAFLLSVLFPNWVNIYMVALGLFMLKLVVYVKEIAYFKKGGSK